MNRKTSKIVLLGMFSAVAYLAVVLFRIPIVSFLKYEPKDAVIVMAGFLFGPLASVAISVVVSFLEFISISDTGLWGMLMNIVSTCSFAFTAAYIYKVKRTQLGAYIGLFSGYVAMVIVMILWNYIVTPFYMGVPREKVAGMLIPVFLPFNAFKGALNAALALLIYKPLMRGLRAAHLIEGGSYSGNQKQKLWNTSTLIIIGVLAATCALLLLAVKGII